MAGLTSHQMAELAALRTALAAGDYEMAAASFELLVGMGTPPLDLLDALGEGLWSGDDDEETGGEDLLEQVLPMLDERAIPALATYFMEENGPDLLVDMVGERLAEFTEAEQLQALRAALREGREDLDDRLLEGITEYLGELAVDSPDARTLLEELGLND